MNNIYRLAFLIIAMAFVPSVAEAANLSFFPASGSYKTGDNFTVGVYVSSSDRSMNAASGVVSFPSDKLEVVSVSKLGSVFSLWVEEPTFSNILGTVSFEGIILNPGFVGASGKVATINFRVKTAGTANLSFSSSSALANDGLGTNVLSSVGSAKFVLGSATISNPQADKERPGYFDVAEVPREDPTDPIAVFIFDASDDIGIDHYEISIDGLDVGIWRKANESERYKAPVHGPGKHTITVKAFDISGNFRSSTAEFFIKGLDVPIFTDYPKSLQSGDVLTVRGTSYPNSDVRIWVGERKGDSENFMVSSDDRGEFIFVSDESFANGVYELWAEAIDERGARSLPTEKVTILIAKSGVFRIGGLVVNILAVIIPLIVLVFALVFLMMYGWHRLSIFKKKLRKESLEAESVLHKSFDIVREDIKNSVDLLEKASGKRSLTKEEDKILRQLKRNLSDAEGFIAKEIRDIERMS